ncbi:MAG TPA: aminotransferase class V-fold PLP-dependent enzyme [Candidatus Acidoferrales bacterium]|nr:aminotransferase class V-fold PLP-dependent enzyme [Candidatus Acidoferrales bacterium]
MATASIPDRAELADSALRLAAEKAQAYVRDIRSRRVDPDSNALAQLATLREALPEAGTDPARVIELLDRIGSPTTVASTGGRYFGFVIGGALPASTAANWLAAAWDQNAALRVMSPIAAECEEIALAWVKELLGLPRECEGGLVTCATAANFTALVAARHALLARLGWNAEEEGLFGAPPIEVIVGEQVHASVLKALTMAGFGSKRLRIVEADAQGRMRAEKLPKLASNAIVCIQAGNVNSGCFDPGREICERAKESGAWVHVDGAFGLWAGASRKYSHLLEGFENANSWSTDAHKWPNVNYDCGIVLVRDAQALRAAMTMSAAYLQAGAPREPMYQTPDASRRARGIELWAALKSLGRAGIADLVERTCEHAQRFAKGLHEAGFEILNDVVINQVLVSFGADATTQEVIRRVQEDGTCWCGGTVWRGRAAMRISVSSWATTEGDVERSLRAIVRIAKDAGAVAR